VSGREIELLQSGTPDARAMQRGLVTRHNLREAIRRKTGSESEAAISRAVLETNGEITIVPRHGEDRRGRVVAPRS